MDVIADAGTVLGGVVLAEDGRGVALAGSHIQYNGNQVGFGIVVLAALGGGAGCVEVAEAHALEAMGGVAIGEDVLKVELGAAIGVGRVLLGFLGNGDRIGLAEDGGRGGEHDVAHSPTDAAAEQLGAIGDVVGVILERILYALAHQAAGAEVHDGINGVVADGAGDQCRIAEAAFHQRHPCRQAFAMAAAQIVEHYHILSCGKEPLDRYASNIPGSAYYQYRHSCCLPFMYRLLSVHAERGVQGRMKVESYVGRERFCRRAAACASSVLAVGCSAAQGIGESVGALKELGFDPTYLIAAVGLLVLIVAFYIFIIVFKKMRRVNRTDMMAGVTYLDVSGMGKQGLLTPEEMAKVRLAMSRQLSRQQQAATKAPVAGEFGLLADPEVQRLEALAQAKARGEAPLELKVMTTKSFAIEPRAETREQIVSDAAADSQGQRAIAPTPTAEPMASAPSAPEPFPAFIDPIPANWQSPAETAARAEEAEVQLPPDIETLVANGLITPEELEVIKQRIRARGK